MYQLKSKIFKNINVGNNYFKLSFKSDLISKDAKPGQFIEVKVTDGLEQLLRKPFGIHKMVTPDIIEILYEVVGKGTELLSKKRPGEVLDVIGPLGNGFNYGSPVTSHPSASLGTPFGRQSPVLIAGGIGVAPLVMLADKLVHSPQSTVHGKVLVLIGAMTKEDILCAEEFRNLGCTVKIATDDGSNGHKGFVTELLKSFLSAVDRGPSTIYACGPKPMMKETANIARKHRIPCQVLLEEYMACGVGVCLGCAVKVRTRDEGRRTLVRRSLGEGGKDEYKMVCKDGPVFKADEVVWE